MRRICDYCERVYDDNHESTVCPHRQFISPEEARRKNRAVRLLGRPVRFAHEKDNGPDRRIVCVTRNGMVELLGMVGEFSPDLFVVSAGGSGVAGSPAS